MRKEVIGDCELYLSPLTLKIMIVSNYLREPILRKENGVLGLENLNGYPYLRNLGLAVLFQLNFLVKPESVKVHGKAAQ